MKIGAVNDKDRKNSTYYTLRSQTSNTQKLLEKVSRLSPTTYYRHHAGFLLERKISIKTATSAYNAN